MGKTYLPNLFKYLFIGLLITFGFGALLTYAPIVSADALGVLMIIAVIAELIFAFFIMSRLHKMQRNTAITMYLIYTALSGITFSSIFVTYEVSSIIFVFLITSLAFGLLAAIGKYTKLDLSKISTYLLVGLIAVIILEIINIFVGSEVLDFTLCIVGLLIFLGYTAYDVQMIIRNNMDTDESNMDIIGAFSLYVDFINIFLKLLRLLGKNKD